MFRRLIFVAFFAVGGCVADSQEAAPAAEHEAPAQPPEDDADRVVIVSDLFTEGEDPTPPDPGPPSEVTLTAEWQGQETGYWCGPASTRIALSTRMAPPSQGTLADYLGTTTAGTDHIGLVRDALNTYLGTSWFETKDMYDPPTQEQRDLLEADIVLNLSNGYPLVANVVSGWRPPGYPSGTIYHYVAIIGYADNGDSVLIADPAAEGSGGPSWGNVPRTYWISVWDLGTWIGGKGYTA